MIGRVLGDRYEIIELIGEGGMAYVYKARCKLLNRFVAVKVLRAEFASDEDFLRKFQKESQSAASLSHPNIVNVYDVGADQGSHYIVMELVNGITLKKFIQEKKTFLSTQEIASITKQIALALDHAHSNGIIHRDIKPHNMLITEEGVVKVADFGIARAASSSTIVKTNEAMGSVHYASPEQARGGFVDARSDLYSLGILMFELATGRVPFDGDTPVSIALKHLKEEVVPPSMVNVRISSSLEGVILKLIHKEPAMRYQGAARLVEDLEKILANPEEPIEIYLNDLDAPTTMLPRVDELEEGPGHKPRKGGGVATEKPSKGKVAVTVIGAFALAVIVVMGVFFGSLMDMMSSKEVAVPELANATQEEATAQLKALGLGVEVGESVESIDIAEGNVVSTTPVKGTMVKEGYVVKLTVSSGGEETKVPSVMNKDLQEAEKLIAAAGLRTGELIEEHSDVAAGTVLHQEPDAGVSVRAKDVVYLTVSVGPEVKTVAMPNLLGKTLDEAKAILTEKQLKLGKVDPKESSTVEAGRVMNQNIEKDTEVEPDTVIDIVISKAKEPGGDEPTSTTPDGQLQMSYFIPTKGFEKAEETIKVVVEQNGVSSVQHEKTHKKSENSVRVVLKGTAGEANLKIYFDDVLFHDAPITFE